MCMLISLTNDHTKQHSSDSCRFYDNKGHLAYQRGLLILPYPSVHEALHTSTLCGIHSSADSTLRAQPDTYKADVAEVSSYPSARNIKNLLQRQCSDLGGCTSLHCSIVHPFFPVISTLMDGSQVRRCVWQM